MSEQAAKLLTALLSLDGRSVTLDDLAELARLTPFKVRKALDELDRAGYIVVVF